MNRLITLASLAAMGAVSLQGQATDDSGRPWSMSAKLRGFYDDNYATAPKDPKPWNPNFPASPFNPIPPGAEESWGINFAVGAKYALVRDQTTITAGVDYDLRWYEARVDNEIDQTISGQIGLNHTFSERFQLDVFDSVVYSEEPDVLEPNQKASYLRTDGNAWRNYGGFGLTTSFTEKLGSRLGYSNTFYDYKEDGPGSRSALLDRMEHLATADLRWTFQPSVVGLIGYQYGYYDYTSSDQLWYTPAPDPTVPTGGDRNQESHYGFAGLDYMAAPGLTAQLRAGFDYARYVNADADDVLAPFVDLALSYEYMQGCKASAGVKHDLHPTDVAMGTGIESFTTSQEATTVYALVAHRILPKVIGTVRGSWQAGTYEGGTYDGETDNFYTADVNLAYEFTQYFAAEAGYAYDFLDSDIPNREYDRNRFYFGVKASY